MEEKCIYGLGGETDQIEKKEMGGICSTYRGEVCRVLAGKPIKSRRQRWAEYVARMEERCMEGFGRETDQVEKKEMEGICSTYGGGLYVGFRWGNRREKDHSEDPGVDGRIILRWIFRKWDVGIWTGLM